MNNCAPGSRCKSPAAGMGSQQEEACHVRTWQRTHAASKRGLPVQTGTPRARRLAHTGTGWSSPQWPGNTCARSAKGEGGVQLGGSCLASNQPTARKEAKQGGRLAASLPRAAHAAAPCMHDIDTAPPTKPQGPRFDQRARPFGTTNSPARINSTDPFCSQGLPS